MPIYLDEQTRPVLIRIIDKWISEHPKDFIADRIKKSLDNDVRRLEIIRDCTHKPGIYAGEKACCVHCGSNYEPGMGEHWTLTDKLFVKAEAVEKPDPTRKGEQEQGSLLNLAQD